MQGVIKSYDPGSGDGTVLCDTDLAEYDLDADALAHSVFRMLRQGQRVVFDVTLGSERTPQGGKAELGGDVNTRSKEVLFE